MGALHNGLGASCALWADHLIGRAPDAALRVEHPSVSWRHASLRWTGVAWELQDLGSLTGTFLDTTRVEAGGRRMLRIGSRLRFGDCDEEWVLIDADPSSGSPTMRATRCAVRSSPSTATLLNAER